MLVESWPLLIAAFSFGLLHALDADHVMAVSALLNIDEANAAPPKSKNLRALGRQRVLRFCARWALGHATVLIGAGLLLFGLGIALPQELQYVAEIAVALLLIGLGLYFFWQCWRQSLSWVGHRHGAIFHRHLHKEGHVEGHRDGHKEGHVEGHIDSHVDGHIEGHSDGHTSGHTSGHKEGHAAVAAHRDDGPSNLKLKQSHAPVMVGMVHGLAGSAPALALVPVMAQGQMVAAMVYLLVFSLAVIISMLVFGLGLGALQLHLQAKYQRVFIWHRQLMATFTVLLGGFWLSQVI